MYPYTKYAFTPSISGYNTLEKLVATKYIPGASLPVSLGSVVTAENGDTYILGQAHDNLWQNTPTLTINASTFISSLGGGYYISPPMFLHKNDRGWFRKINQTFIKAPLSATVYNVKNAPYNATGDGSTNDTTAIQSAINACGTTGGTVFFPAGTYMVNGDGHTPLVVPDNINIKIDPAATVKVITNDYDSYICFTVVGKTNVTFYGGGTILGERNTHTGIGGEWGFGINITGSNNIVVENLSVKDFWGDGCYVGSNGTIQCKNIFFYHVYTTNNRRQGFTIESCEDNVVIDRCLFTNINGTPPKSGIDIEPDAGVDVAKNVKITNSSFLNNAGTGIEIFGLANVGALDGLVVLNNVCCGNDAMGISIKGSFNGVFRGNYCTNNNDSGLYLIANSVGNLLDNNLANNNTNTGINIGGVSDTTSANNTISNNKCLKNLTLDIYTNATNTTETNNEYSTHN
jgi:parallel beta-helix repeat protein